MRRKGFATWGLALFLLAGKVDAQFNVPRFDFSFSNPGARSLGFGGAFAALADDATAAYANPAGLVQLTEPEVSIDGRYWRRSPDFLAGGRFDGEVTGRGIDTVQGFVIGHDESRTSGPSFVAAVFPKGRWSFAVYGHQLAKFEERSDSQGLFLDTGPFSFPLVGRIPGNRDRVSLEVQSGGLAASWRMNDRLSFGLDLVVSSISLESQNDSYLPDDDSEEALYGQIHFLPQRRYSTDRIAIRGTDLSFHAGVLGRLTDRLTGALFYRRGASADGHADLEAGPALPFDAHLRNPATFKVPDVAGGGLAYRSSGGAVTLATEIDRVGYAGLIRVRSTEESEADAREYRDAWEYHFGAEYALLHTAPLLAFRAGYWLEANGDDVVERHNHHWAAGLGLAMKSFQLDLGADFSKPADTLSLSCIYTF